MNPDGQQNKIIEEAAQQVHVEQLGDPAATFPRRENASARAREPLRAPVDAWLLSPKNIFQMRQPAIQANTALDLLLPGMRSIRGSRNSPSPAVSTFADQMPAQTGMAPWRAKPAPIVNIR